MSPVTDCHSLEHSKASSQRGDDARCSQHGPCPSGLVGVRVSGCRARAAAVTLLRACRGVRRGTQRVGGGARCRWSRGYRRWGSCRIGRGWRGIARLRGHGGVRRRAGFRASRRSARGWDVAGLRRCRAVLGARSIARRTIETRSGVTRRAGRLALFTRTRELPPIELEPTSDESDEQVVFPDSPFDGASLGFPYVETARCCDGARANDRPIDGVQT